MFEDIFKINQFWAFFFIKKKIGNYSMYYGIFINFLAKSGYIFNEKKRACPSTAIKVNNYS